MRTSSFVPADEPFFREWSARAPEARRNLARAREFAVRLGLDVQAVPAPLIVVGSKGKGTAATYASAALAAGGCRVGTITSPGYRSNRERIRLDGLAISAADYEALSGRVAAALPRTVPAPGDGYLSPTGLFTLAGVWWLLEAGCDALVLEAGIGGGSDEVSLFTPRTVAITRIFGEHLGILGDTVPDVVREKAAVVRPETPHVLTIPQSPDVAAVLREVVPRVAVVVGEPPVPLPAGLSGQNAALGVWAADKHGPAVDRGRLAAVLDTVTLPGRLSVHRRGGQTWVVDSAVDPVGVRAAVDWCRRTMGAPSSVVVAFPDSKRPAACVAELAGSRLVPVSTENRRLTFDDPVWDGPSLRSGHAGRLPVLARLDLNALGPRVLALGTISFVGEVLETLDVPLDRSFRA